jgi:hypothetical protein
MRNPSSNAAVPKSRGALRLEFVCIYVPPSGFALFNTRSVPAERRVTPET